MEQSPTWAANRFSRSQEIPRILWNRNVHYCIYNVGHLSLSWAWSIQAIPPHSTSWRSVLILSSHLRLGFSSSKMLWMLCKIQIATLCVMTLCDPIRYRRFGRKWCLHLQRRSSLPNRWQGFTFQNTWVYVHWWSSHLSSVVLIRPIEVFSQECAALRRPLQ